MNEHGAFAGVPATSAGTTILIRALMILALTHTIAANAAHLEARIEGELLRLSWFSVPGNVYQVQARSRLDSDEWKTIDTVIPSDYFAAWSDPLEGTRFYRLALPNGDQILYESPPREPWAAPIALVASGLSRACSDEGVCCCRDCSQNGVCPPGYEAATCRRREDCSGDFCKIEDRPGGVSMAPSRGIWGCGDRDRDGYGVGADCFNLPSGETVAAAVDLVIPGRGLDFIWARQYRSRVGPNTAQGNGWDSSCNIHIRAGPNATWLEVSDGNGRRDIFLRQPDGTYGRDEFFREGRFESNGVFVLTFADTGMWRFHPLDGSPQRGKIMQSTDRNGNSLSFTYDPAGRLASVTDTLGRPIAIAYNPDGFIESVTDFTGRQVRYAYYADGEVGGGRGDLKSVTSPAVTGTPNGNDFPAGKTVIYTYSTGSPLEALNHNLLTITDGKGQTWLRNTYAATTDPTDLNFDRVVRQEIGNPNEALMYQYARQTPSPANHQAVLKVIINDRVGNVSERFYDAGNRLVVLRQFTGRAKPGLVTTDTENRPMEPLRTNDPPFFETRLEWNSDSLPTRVVYPASNRVQMVFQFDLDPTTPRRHRSNLREWRAVAGPLGGDQTELVWQFEHDPRFGSGSAMLGLPASAFMDDNDPAHSSKPRTVAFASFPECAPVTGDDGCGPANFTTREPCFPDPTRYISMFPTRSIDPRSNVTHHTYDARGNRIQTVHRVPSIVEDFEYNAFGQLTARTLPDNGSGHRRRDEFTYHAAGPQRGYLHQVIVDAGPDPARLRLATTYEYDAVGNVVRRIDPRGNDTLFTVNQLNQVVRVESPADLSAVRYQRDFFYDANNCLARVDMQNIGDDGTLQANSHFTTTYEYEILNRLVRVSREVGPGQGTVTEYAYDANRNFALLRSPEAVNGNQPANTVQFLYDERDLLLCQIMASAAEPGLVTDLSYTLNGRLAGMALTCSGFTNKCSRRSNTYDGFDRVIRATDGMGNVTAYHYDPNGNVISERFDGELNDVPGSANNIRLAEATYQYDAMDRLIRVDRAFFDPASQSPTDDGAQTTRFEYGGAGHLTRLTNDRGNATRYAYDGANRLAVVIDAKSNRVEYAYDAAGNITRVTEVEKSDLGAPDETFITHFAWDPLNRRIETVDNLGNTNRFTYDSRGNPVSTRDARGNLSRFDYDGLSRLVRTTRFMTASGDGTSPVIDTVVTMQAWDDNSRLVSQTDDNTNTTRYAYDALDRRIKTTFADGTFRTIVYDPRDNLIRTTDANGTTVDSDYDLLDRLRTNTVRRAPGVGGTTFERYAYDGLSRLVRAEDDDSLVTRAHDSLGNITRETQQPLPGGSPRVVAATFDGVGNRLSLTYPGGRVITSAYDALNRTRTVMEGPLPLAIYSYMGPSRLARREAANSTALEVSYDGLRRVTRTRHCLAGIVPAGIGGGADCVAFDERVYGWDAAGNKTLGDHLTPVPPPDSRRYSYDSLDRLVRTDRLGFAPPPPTVYSLDGVGNRTQVLGGPNPGVYTMDPTPPEPADFQVNQYTTTPFEARTYDRNGNLDATFYLDRFVLLADYSVDFRNRLVQVVSGPSLQMKTNSHHYDCLGRRIQTVETGAGNLQPQVRQLFYAGSQEIEEQSDTGQTSAIYVAGAGDLLQMRRGLQTFYYHADDLGSIRKVTDAAGNVVEGYDYDDYGEPSFFDGEGGPLLGGTQIGNPWMFQAMRWDAATGWYFVTVDSRFRWVESNESRFVDPRSGRFIAKRPGSRDPDLNGFTFAHNNPLTPASFTILETGRPGSPGRPPARGDNRPRSTGGDSETIHDRLERKGLGQALGEGPRVDARMAGRTERQVRVTNFFDITVLPDLAP